MGTMVVCEFSEGNVLSPRCGICSTKDPEIGLDFLVYSFGFSISLRVVGSGESEFVTKEFSKFFGKG